MTGAQAARPGGAANTVARTSAGPSFQAANAPAGGTAAPGEITRTELFEDVVVLDGVRYRMLTVELVFGPHAETPVHVHPGPSSGYMQEGRITVSLDGKNGINTYAAGSAIAHPWDHPHSFRNTSSDTARMVSFELIPIR
jgi:quercetin dioxygenase-like cupin family protein